jgi:hypothetical protein
MSREFWRKHLKIRKRIEMTIETEKFLTVRLGHARHDEFCETCDSKTPLLTVAETAKFAGTNPRTIYRLIGEGQLHFRETAAGLLLVCFDSFSTKQQPSAKE